ncbi:MAG TPA: nucleotidyltransferase domain-containing protein [Bdellovibrionota bacterium]|nr:nucleotidyltransferase domain-containing protein [Bdellovibrionota bacterium]
MTKIQGLSSDQLKKIVNIIHTHLPNVHIFAFGSRITGTPRKYSDFDIALDNGHPIDLSKLTKIKNTLSETDLPITVDLVDYSSVSSEFKTIIDKQKLEL